MKLEDEEALGPDSMGQTTVVGFNEDGEIEIGNRETNGEFDPEAGVTLDDEQAARLLAWLISHLRGSPQIAVAFEVYPAILKLTETKDGRIVLKCMAHTEKKLREATEAIDEAALGAMRDAIAACRAKIQGGRYSEGAHACVDRLTELLDAKEGDIEKKRRGIKP